MEYLYDALSYLSDALYYIVSFFQTIGDFIIEAFTWFSYILMKMYIEFKISTVKVAYSVAQSLLGDYEVYAAIGEVFNELPDNLRYAATQLGVVQAIRIIVDAAGTAFILRIIGW
ncbi:hypothetical protein F9817_08545 [Vibrio sp. CAIM 722]|uniref:DUF2523 domain-containing protein n=1 Tax=Vibrio eleionomae TaxID=2653505 RepID=A0A7X4LJT3_9VIBR|nr:DUF2523 family protein [Vibrio eleionomae]MZI93244.1 hypothetical protein [Vibrio eleionomae]